MVGEWLLKLNPKKKKKKKRTWLRCNMLEVGDGNENDGNRRLLSSCARGKPITQSV